MEDKLVKYHRSHLYFYAKKVGVYFSVFIGASVLVAVPVAIAVTVRNNNTLHQEKKETEKNPETSNYEVGNLVY